MNVEQLNALDIEPFVEAVGWVFEHSPWVAARAWEHRPFATLEALHQAMIDQVEAASRDEQLALLRAHPDLGTHVDLTAASQSEQAGAGLDRQTPGESVRLHSLNAAYREKFGFPFILAVKGATRRDIFVSLTSRFANSPEEEFREALRQVYRIAWFRLDQ
jgi:2-oxo-4-hydroxy-4-carboxy-5-ureidoimidazoline decarboxylase